MAEPLLNVPVTVKYTLDTSQFIAALETVGATLDAIARECADAAERLRAFAEASDGAAVAEPKEA